MMGHEVKPLDQRFVTRGACQDVRNRQDAPVEFFFASPGAEGHVVVDLVGIAADQGEPPFRRRANRRWRPGPTELASGAASRQARIAFQGSSSGFVT